MKRLCTHPHNIPASRDFGTGIYTHVYKTLFIVLATCLFFSCSEKQEETIANHPALTEQVNNTIVTEQDSTITNPVSEEEPVVFTKTSWGYNHGPGHFLYSNEVDLLVNEKEINREKDEIQDDLNSGYDALDESTLAQLPTKALMYYCLAYPCAYSQNCAAIGLPQNNKHYFLFYLPPPLDDRHLSPLQKQALEARKDSVTLVLKQIFDKATTIDLEYLNLVADINLIELIPVLSQKADFDTNLYIYTLLIALMRDNEFKPFTESAFLEKLREKTGEWGQMEATDEDAKQLLTFAMQFYQSKTKK